MISKAFAGKDFILLSINGSAVFQDILSPDAEFT
jgi:hypothetical protein